MSGDLMTYPQTNPSRSSSIISSESSPLPSNIPLPVFRTGLWLEALFDLSAVPNAFHPSGDKGRMEYFLRLHKSGGILKAGPTFPLVKKLTRFNKGDHSFFVFSLLTDLPAHLSPLVRRSLSAHGLDHIDAEHTGKSFFEIYDATARQIFTRHDSGFDLILSARSSSAQKLLLKKGLPSNYVDPRFIPREISSKNVVFSFDWDYCAAIATAPVQSDEFHIDCLSFDKMHSCNPEEQLSYVELWNREESFSHEPCHPGPNFSAFLKLCSMRKFINVMPNEETLSVGIVSARANGGAKRILPTCEFWNALPDFLETNSHGEKHVRLLKHGADVHMDDAKSYITKIQEKCPSTLALWTPCDYTFVRNNIISLHDEAFIPLADRIQQEVWRKQAPG